MRDDPQVDNEPDGTIDMTSEADQSFLDAEADKGGIDEVEYFEERGWDTDRLQKPEGYNEGED